MLELFLRGDLICTWRVIIFWQGLYGKSQHSLSSEKEEKCHNAIVVQEMLDQTPLSQ